MRSVVAVAIACIIGITSLLDIRKVYAGQSHDYSPVALAIGEFYEWFGDNANTVLWREDRSGARVQFRINGLATKLQLIDNKLYYAFKGQGATATGGVASPYLGCVTRKGTTCRALPFIGPVGEIDDFALVSTDRRAALDSRSSRIVVNQGREKRLLRTSYEPGVFRVVSSSGGAFWFAATPVDGSNYLIKFDRQGIRTKFSLGGDGVVDIAACGSDSVAVAVVTPNGRYKIRTIGTSLARQTSAFEYQVYSLRSDGNQLVAIAGSTAQYVLFFRANKAPIKIASLRSHLFRDLKIRHNVVWMLADDGKLTHLTLSQEHGFCG